MPSNTGGGGWPELLRRVTQSDAVVGVCGAVLGLLVVCAAVGLRADVTRGKQLAADVLAGGRELADAVGEEPVGAGPPEGQVEAEARARLLTRGHRRGVAGRALRLVGRAVILGVRGWDVDVEEKGSCRGRHGSACSRRVMRI
jgi:hypothetical protein